MSVHRSPISGQLASGSGSHPDLYSLTKEENVTQRKRKHDFDYASQLCDFRKEIMSFFKEFANNQNQNTMKIQQELTEIKEEIKSVKTANENLSLEYSKINNELKNMKIENAEIKEKIQILEGFSSEGSQINISNIKGSNSIITNPLSLSQESLIRELRERCQREKNIILVGIKELNNKKSTLRRDHDYDEVYKKTKLAYEDCPKPLKTFRLGKYNPEKDRPIKIYYESAETVKQLLRNKSKLGDGFRLYPDQTPMQQSHLKKLADELKRREAEGETNLAIKYINGFPKIITQETKNSDQ